MPVMMWRAIGQFVPGIHDALIRWRVITIDIVEWYDIRSLNKKNRKKNYLCRSEDGAA
jgi:hypothetical protein